MKNILCALAAATALLFGPVALSLAPASAAMALCKDGSQYNGSSHRGACSRHGGVQQWLNEPGQPPQQQVNTAPPSSPAPLPAPQPPQQQVNTAPPSSPAPVPAPQMPNFNVGTGSNTNVAAANTNGQVWANLKSKVYHCPGDRYYGKTKSGEFLPESQAIAQGFRPDHGKACAHA